MSTKNAMVDGVLSALLGTGFTTTTIMTFSVKDYNEMVYGIMVTLTAIIAGVKLYTKYIRPFFSKKVQDQEGESE